MDFKKIQSTLQRTMDQLKKAEEAGDVEEMDRLSGYMDRLKPVMGKVEASIKNDPPLAPTAPAPKAIPATPRDTAMAEVGVNESNPPPRAYPSAVTIPQWAQDAFPFQDTALPELKMPSEEMVPGRLLPPPSAAPVAPATPPVKATYVSPPGLASSFPGGSSLGGPVSSEAKQGGDPFAIPFEPIKLGQMGKKDKVAQPKTSPAVSPEEHNSPSADESGPLKNNMLITAATEAGATGEKAQLDEIVKEIGEKPESLTLENLAIMLLMGAPRAFSKIMSEQSEYRSALRNFMAEKRRNERADKRDKKEDEYKERDLQVKEDNAASLDDYRRKSLGQKVTAEDMKAARDIMRNAAFSDPNDVEWARRILQAHQASNNGGDPLALPK